MENELDLVVFEDDNGNELTMEVLDYLFYEGKEYALLAELGVKRGLLTDGHLLQFSVAPEGVLFPLRACFIGLIVCGLLSDRQL